MEMCARCHKRMAVVFITRLENGESKNEGICLKCAKELGIKPIDDILKKMGISNEEFDQMTDDVDGFMQEMIPEEGADSPAADSGGAPAIDFNKLLRGNLGGAPGTGPRRGAKQGKRKSRRKENFWILTVRISRLKRARASWTGSSDASANLRA